jgi:putative membrane protein
LQSTSSSADAGAAKSATEELADRYRHLFVLPKTIFLIPSAIAVSFLLSYVVGGGARPQAFLLSSLVALASAFVIANILKLADKSTIATFRRTLAVILASEIIWVVLLSVADGYSLTIGSVQPTANTLLFGGLAAIGFEFLVVRGAFSHNSALSLGLGVVHPIGTLLVIGNPQGAVPYTLIPGVAGLASLIVAAAFPLILSRRKTSRGHSAVELFQAFMKTWTERDSTDLEAIIQDHSEVSAVTTKVLKFQKDDGNIFIFLPGVHPGPFFPVGSYNMPGLICKEMLRAGPVLTLHRPGGHERNLASNEQARQYASRLRELALEIEPTTPGAIRGPICAQIGKATVNSLAFSKDLLLTISFAPLGSDDLETEVEENLAELSLGRGFNASVVDAHNSIGKQQEHPDAQDEGWVNLINETARTAPKAFRIASAHSREVDFSPGDDVTENGIWLLMLESGGEKSVLVLADANNATPGLKENVAKALDMAGYRLIEFCTSDSHDMAAKGLTVTRGYKALGEDTPIDSISTLILTLSKMAESRLLPCKYGSGELTQDMKLFGSKSLDDFALITKASSKFASKYSRFAVVFVLVLFAVSIVA